MTLIKCKECSKEISKKAKVCPHCGAKNDTTSAFANLLIVMVIAVGWWMILSKPDSPITSIVGDGETAPSNQDPPLEVVSWSCSQENGFVSVSGEVKNISDAPLQNVVAVATFKTKDAVFVKVAEAIVKYNPILPGQTTPFEALDTDNPAIESCEIGFKKLMGGTLDYKVRKNRKGEVK